MTLGLILIGLLLPLQFSRAQDAQDEPKLADSSEVQRYDVVLTLDEGKIRQLQQTGILKASLPKHFLNRVDSIVLSRVDRFVTEPLLLDEDVQKRDRMLGLRVDASFIDHLAYQPIKIRIYESNFSSIVLQYQPVRMQIKSKASDVDLEKDTPPVFLRLNNDRGITGHIKDGDSLKLTTEFGEIAFPFERSIGIGFNADSDGRVVVLFSNGDLLSGMMSVDKIVFKTKFGDKEIPLTEIRSVTQSGKYDVIRPGNDPGSRWSVQSTRRN